MEELGENEVRVLKVLYRIPNASLREIMKYSGLSSGDAETSLNTLIGKRVIIQTEGVTPPMGGAFSLRAGQTDLLRRIGILA